MSLDLTISSAAPGSSAQPSGDGLSPLESSLYRFSVEEYHRMPAAGILLGQHRVELLDGVIVQMTPIGPPHSRAVEKLRRMIERLLPPGWHVRTQHPIRLATSEPQPDLAVVRGEVDDFGERHPTAADVELLVEVADSSLNLDRDRKTPIYAAAGIPHYWIVDLDQRRVEVRQDPRPGYTSVKPVYAAHQELQPLDALPLTLDGREVGRLDLAELFR